MTVCVHARPPYERKSVFRRDTIHGPRQNSDSVHRLGIWYCVCFLGFIFILPWIPTAKVQNKAFSVLYISCISVTDPSDPSSMTPFPHHPSPENNKAIKTPAKWCMTHALVIEGEAESVLCLFGCSFLFHPRQQLPLFSPSASYTTPSICRVLIPSQFLGSENPPTLVSL